MPSTEDYGLQAVVDYKYQITSLPSTWKQVHNQYKPNQKIHQMHFIHISMQDLSSPYGRDAKQKLRASRSNDSKQDKWISKANKSPFEIYRNVLSSCTSFNLFQGSMTQAQPKQSKKFAHMPAIRKTKPTDETSRCTIKLQELWML